MFFVEIRSGLDKGFQLQNCSALNNLGLNRPSRAEPLCMK